MDIFIEVEIKLENLTFDFDKNNIKIVYFNVCYTMYAKEIPLRDREENFWLENWSKMDIFIHNHILSTRKNS